jgi:hypothetical protein
MRYGRILFSTNISRVKTLGEYDPMMFERAVKMAGAQNDHRGYRIAHEKLRARSL